MARTARRLAAEWVRVVAMGRTVEAAANGSPTSD
jgi:hypothetical protein